MTKFLFTPGTAGLAKVICCGACKPGDNCLEKCRVIGKVPKDLKLTCCGKCHMGDKCLQKCAGGTCCGR